MNEIIESLHFKVRALPDKPGVYMFRNRKNKVIYVGKAKSLKKRVSSYFTKGGEDQKKKSIQIMAVELETINTETETDALILENGLIKLHKPILNVRLRDDKTYPYLMITREEKFPRIEITREKKEDGNQYLGPFTDSKALKLVLRHALTIFPIASCKRDIMEIKFERPCLYYQLKRCTAPCVYKINQEDYMENVENIVKFFEGKQKELYSLVESKMNEAAKKLDFEKAAKLRDNLKSLEKIMQRQTIISKDQNAEYDVIGFAKEEKISIIQILMMREGRITDQRNFTLDLPFETDDSEIIYSFIQMYYSRSDYIPNNIITRVNIGNVNPIIEKWLKEKKGKKRKVMIAIQPDNDEHFDLIKLAEENARYKLNSLIKIDKMKDDRIKKGLEELKSILKLEKLPNRIEGFDISTIQGSDTVASCVVFENGKSKRNSYRKFRIKSIDKPDDFSAMKEVVRRRFTGSLSQKEPQPDLILIDGGKGQVNISKAELNKAELTIPIIGLAKEFEVIHFPDDRESLKLDEKSEGLKILQQVRDEAHRFAITYHRKKRSKRMVQISLEKIPGLGEKRIKKLLNHFESIEKIKNASVEELQECDGISKKIAQEIYNFYNKIEF